LNIGENRTIKIPRKEAYMDFSNMTMADWIIRAAIFGVLACVVIGTLQNLFTAIKNSRGK